MHQNLMVEVAMLWKKNKHEYEINEEMVRKFETRSLQIRFKILDTLGISLV